MDLYCQLFYFLLLAMRIAITESEFAPWGPLPDSLHKNLIPL